MNATMMPLPLANTQRHVAGAVRCESPSCARCGGFLVDERCMDIGESLGGYWFMALRCIQCGDIIDEVILRNRHAHLAETQDVVRAA